MAKTIFVDANVILRFFLNDHPQYSLRAKKLFLNAESGEIKLYLDEVVVAEVIWVLGSFYKIKRLVIAEKLETIVFQDWIVNFRKDLIQAAISLYKKTNLDYIDCWGLVVSKALKIHLETYDEKIKKFLQ